MADKNRIKRIVHVLYSGLGGHGAVMFGMLDAGFFAGAEHIAILTGVEPPLEDYTTRLEQRSMAWRYVPKMPRRDYIAYYRALRRAIFDGDPDLVFVHGLATTPSVVRNRSKAVVLLRETEPQSTKSIKDWVSLALAHANVDAVVHLTRDAADTAAGKLRFLQRPGKVHIIANGLNIDDFSPAPGAPDGLLSGPVIRLGMVARIQPTKDHLTLVQAFGKLCVARPGLDLRLEIAGDGATRPALEAEISRLGLEERVTLHGTLGSGDVRELLRSLDIYVHATFGETMSNSIMQAMAIGLPIIASAVSGVTDMVGEDVGLLYPSRDVDALQAAIEGLLDDPETACRLACAAREQALQRYDAQLTARSYETLAVALHGARPRR